MQLHLFLSTALLASARAVRAHSGTEQRSASSAEADWATRHMAAEHHITNYDAGAFFTLHDFDGSGDWSAAEIVRTYGLEDESTKHVSQEKKDEVVRKVMDLIDFDKNGRIDRAEWMRFSAEKGRLPDFGLGDGRHGDDEYEYEINHYEKFHGPDTKEEDLTHPEDIAHFKKHNDEEEAEERQQKLDVMSIVEQNIPAKFRRVPAEL
ncbi:MAG: hypothetical protein M1826_005267 [Phylliscum demangeonii]|nr:MAG: hypothetical protein M1826_005267 [Phylliscum demangeonii]